MGRTVTENLSPRRLSRYAIIPLCCGALAMTMAAAAPPGVHPDATLTLVATIPVGQDPISMADDQATGTVYVACTGPSADVYAIDSATNTVTATIPVGHDPEAIGVDAATDTIYVANARDNTVSVIDGATNTVTTTIPVGQNPYWVSVDPSNDKVFVSTYQGIAVIDGSTNTVATTLSESSGSAVDPTTKRLWIFSERASLEALSVSNYKVVATVPLSGHISGTSIVADPVTDMIYIGSRANDHHGIVVINGKTATETGFIRLGGKVMYMTLDQRNDTIFVTTRYKLIEVSAKTDKATATVTLPALPVAVDPGTHTAYTARYGSPNVFAYKSSPGRAG